MSQDLSEDLFFPFAYLMETIMGKAIVQRRDYDQALSMLTQVYKENTVLRQRLADLERLASSWAGAPDNHEAIRQARQELRKGIGRIWL
jgi:BMFP domain-containing protein YqiC